MKKIVFGRDGEVRMGSEVIGTWDKEFVDSSAHFRPLQYEGMTVYYANLIDEEYLQDFDKEVLRSKIANHCKDGIILETENDEV